MPAFPPAIILLLGCYSVLDSCSLGLGEQQRYYYAILGLLTGVTLAVMPVRRQGSTLNTPLMRLWIATTAIGFVMVLTQPTVHPSYVIGDAASFSMPLLFAMFATRQPQLFAGRHSLQWIAALLVLAMVVALLFPNNESRRFQEPSMLLMAFAWVYLAMARTPSSLLAGSIGVTLVFVATLFSGARFALILWIAMGGTIIALGLASKFAKRFCYFGAALAAASLMLGIAGPDALASLEELRVGGLIQRIQEASSLIDILEDGSLQNRVFESDDALYTRRTQHGLLEWALGSGHGATFETGYAVYGDRALEDGTVHHIHFGIVLLYYRYGLQGVIVYIAFAVSCLRQLSFLRRVDRSDPLFVPSLVFCIGSLGFLGNFMLFNQLIDPIASFTMAGQVVTRSLWQERRQQSFMATSKQRPASPHYPRQTPALVGTLRTSRR